MNLVLSEHSNLFQVSKATCKPQTFFMKKQERIDAAKKRIQELKTLIKYWNNGTSKTSS